MRLNNVDRMVIYELSKLSSPASVNAVFSKIKIPLNELIKSVFKLEKKEILLLLDNSKVRFTPSGRALAQRISSRYRNLDERQWRSVPEHVQRDVVNIDFYTPRINVQMKRLLAD